MRTPERLPIDAATIVVSGRQRIEIARFGWAGFLDTTDNPSTLAMIDSTACPVYNGLTS
ncbi:hypothetical protein Sinac_6198 [Singulisphaera acidiphila DSM 18658]|uniref:Uncharacterized protein n=1 Tax=Singulisphaera acidiphila (strain ATCC BAA-1392 / DSM 18658 / VKM B-2454 / MOB10) TaxID=886293 RepID=L0DNM9_SINAD|nr:hypothetical protein Sinac_6198 [Singulisphaera acidiphila DSM 18658]